MFKKILLIFIFIFSCFIVACNKQKEEEMETIDLSMYEINENDPLGNNDISIGLTIEDFLTDKGLKADKIIITFEVEEMFYGKFPRERAKIDDSINNTFERYAQYAIYDNFYRYELSSLQKITIDEYNALSDDEKKQYEVFYLMSNPTNFITNSVYDFKIITPIPSDKNHKVELEVSKLDFHKYIAILNKSFIFNANELKKTIFIPLFAPTDSGTSTMRSIQKENGTEGLLFPEKQYGYYNGELLYEYDGLQDTIWKIGGSLSLIRIIKSISNKSQYQHIDEFIQEGSDSIKCKIVSDYLFTPCDKFRDLIINYEKTYNEFFKEIDDQELISSFSSNTFPRVLGYNIYTNEDKINEDLSKIEGDKSLSLFQIDIDKSSGYYVLANRRNGHADQMHYYIFENSKDVDIFGNLYYICKGKIVKDLTNNIDYNIDVVFAIDVTRVNDIEYHKSSSGNFAEGYNYVYDGLLVAFNNEKFNSVKDKSIIYFGSDIEMNYVFDLRKDNNELKIGINYVYSKELDNIPSDISNCVKLYYDEIRDLTNKKMYASKIAQGTLNENYLVQYFVENKTFSFTVEGNKITLVK